MISFYFCAGTSMAKSLNTFQAELEAEGHLVVSRWHQLHNPRLEITENENILRGRAFVDLLDIKGSAIVIAFSNKGEMAQPKASGRGGRHFELGYAYANGLPIWLVGEPEHAFHSLVAKEFKNWTALMDEITNPIPNRGVRGLGVLFGKEGFEGMHDGF